MRNLQRGDKTQAKKNIYIYISTYKNLLFLMRSISSNFTLLSKDICKFLLSILRKKFSHHYDADTSRASHQHLGLNSAVEPTKLFGPRQPTELLVSLTVCDEITDYLAD